MEFKPFLFFLLLFRIQKAMKRTKTYLGLVALIVLVFLVRPVSALCYGTPVSDCSQWDGSEVDCILFVNHYSQCAWTPPTTCSGTLRCQDQYLQSACEMIDGCIYTDSLYADGVFQPFIVGNGSQYFTDVKVEVYYPVTNELLAEQIFPSNNNVTQSVVWFNNYTQGDFEFNMVYNASYSVLAYDGWKYMEDVPTYIGRTTPRIGGTQYGLWVNKTNPDHVIFGYVGGLP